MFFGPAFQGNGSRNFRNFSAKGEDMHTANTYAPLVVYHHPHRLLRSICARSSLHHEIYRLCRDCEGGPNAKRNSSWFYFGVAGGSANQIITMVGDAHPIEWCAVSQRWSIKTTSIFLSSTRWEPRAFTWPIPSAVSTKAGTHPSPRCCASVTSDPSCPLSSSPSPARPACRGS